MERTMKLYGDKVFGETVSNYGLEHGYLDYYTLARIVGDRILNNSIRSAGYPEDWELVNGDYEYDEDCYVEVYQDYIISEYGYKILAEYTDELVYYNNELDIYVWGITHWGTSWDYVLTDVRLVSDDEPND